MAKARSATTAKQSKTVADESPRPVRLDLTPETHRLLRVIAANAETSMAAYARETLEKHLRAEATKQGIKI